MIDAFIQSLPEKVSSTDNFEEGAFYRKKDKAIGYRYIEHNQIYKKFIVVDVDAPNSAFLWYDLNLPAPSIITISRDTGRCHYKWALKTPVIYTESARRRPQRFYEAIDVALTKAIPGADPRYVGKFTKNPLHPHWNVIQHNVLYDLEDFGEYIDITSERKLVTKESSNGSRNCTIFQNLCQWAYPSVKGYALYESFQSDAEARAFDINATFNGIPTGALTFKEVLGIAKSVGRWTWKHRHESLRYRGVMNLPDDMPLKEKQGKGAGYTHAKRTESTQKRIVAAIAALRTTGKPVTQQAVSVSSGLSIRAVKRNWKAAEDECNLYAK